MAFHKPNSLFVSSAIGTALIFAIKYAAQHLADQNHFLANLPYGLFTALAVAFWLGCIAENVSNPKGWSRRTWHEFVEVAVIEMSGLVSEIYKEQDWKRLKVSIRFIKSSKKVSISIRVHAALNISHAAETFILETHEYKNVEKDITKSFYAASFPPAPSPGYSPGYHSWGTRLRETGDTNGMISLLNGTQNLIEIDIKTWRGRQKLRIFAAFPATDSHNFGRFIVAEGRDIAFPSIPIPAQES